MGTLQLLNPDGTTGRRCDPLGGALKLRSMPFRQVSDEPVRVA
jgi:hypothetical protein